MGWLPSQVMAEDYAEMVALLERRHAQQDQKRQEAEYKAWEREILKNNGL